VNRLIVIGTRKSKLALWQAQWVKTQLASVGIASKLVPVSTQGDRILDVSISEIGSKGVFTKELENKLQNGEIDIAVHSAKDMPSVLPDSFEIIAFGPRTRANDVLISTNKVNLANPLVIGTSSTRRVACLRHFYPHIETIDMRGNLQTRIEKMKSGACDALILAYAGVQRLNYENMIQHVFDEKVWIPAVGQGSIAVEAHSSLDSVLRAKIRSIISHAKTVFELIAERAFLEKFEGGCSIPIFAHATSDQNNILLRGGIISLDGKEKISRERSGEDPKDLGEALALEVLEAGGQKILKKIKVNLKSRKEK
jgi:hydroxymethylbilane synthase